jgi:hypothetical protein
MLQVDLQHAVNRRAAAHVPGAQGALADAARLSTSRQQLRHKLQQLWASAVMQQLGMTSLQTSTGRQDKQDCVITWIY